MSMSFHFSQAWRLLKRRSRAAISILFVGAIATIGLAFAIAGFMANSSDMSALSQHIVLNVFLNTDADSLQAESVRSTLLSLPEIQSVEVVSSSQAREEFSERYGTPIDSLLPENPFPISLIAVLRERYRTTTGVENTVAKVQRIPYVKETIYRSSYVEAVESRVRSSASLAIVAGSVLLVIFIVTLYSTLRNGIGLTSYEASVLHLTGARRSFIAAPYLLFGLALCALGIGVGSSVTVALYANLQQSLPWVSVFPPIALAYAAAGMFVASTAICIFTVLRTASARS